MSDQTFPEAWWEVVEKRLETMPNEICLDVLGHSFTKTELVAEVKKRSPVGIDYAEMQLDYIKWLAQKKNLIFDEE